MAATGELKETLVNFLWEDCYYAITEGEKILPRQRNRTVDESARLICNGEPTLDDRINISEMVDSIIFMMASAYRKGCSDAEKKECA